jgi:hypothetical protein
MLENARLKRMEKSPKSLTVTRVDRLLSKIKNEDIRIDRNEKNIGGHELLLSELIERANVKRGYISKAQMLRINLTNITMIAQSSQKNLNLHDSKRSKRAR